MKQVILERVCDVWAFVLISTFVVGLGIAIFNLATGNYCSTASFEF
jgi:flagellar biosynthesis protein FliQ